MVLPASRVDLKLLAAALAVFLGWPAPAASQEPAALRDADVPTVAEIRGFPTGATFSTYRDIERVVEGIAAASPRVLLETYGSSVEGRPLRLAWVSSPGNLARLEELRAANRALAEPGGAADSALADRPVFVWLSFGVHGDEASPSEAALELLDYLAAARDPGVEEWLERAVIVIDPLLNPDGHERYVAWYRAVAGFEPNPDPRAREHRPPWPGGRTNHWYADLNRDWAWGVQPETRARLAAYLATLPQVHVDFHEMDPGSSYFFFPAAAPFHLYYPESTARWGRVFGDANAAAFDARGWTYFTEEDFDLFYPGYGDSWPSFQGATGMTYEQAGGGEAGVLYRRADGSLLTLAERVEHHRVAALTTIATAVRHRAERLADFADFWRPATRVASGAPAAYLLPRAGADADSLAALLVRQGIEVDTLAAELSAAGIEPYPGAPAVESLGAGTYLVRGDQPRGRYLAALMAPGWAAADTSLFYDITGWALPYLFDVAAYRTDRTPAVTAHPWRGPGAPDPERAEAVAGAAGAVAYAWPYGSVADVAAAGRLAAAGWRVGVATRGFRAGGRAWSAGSFVVTLARQPDSLAGPAGAARLRAALAESGARAAPLASFRTAEGIDLGSDRFRTIPLPRVALAAGPATDPGSVGAAWQLLARAGIPIDLVSPGDLAARPGADGDSLAGLDRAGMDLAGYTAIVLPDGPGAAAYAAAFGEGGVARLRRWVEDGGTLIGIRSGAAWLTAGESGITEVELAEAPDPPEEDRLRPAAAREADDVRRRIPGTLVQAVVDTTSLLGFGFPGGAAAVLVRDPVELALAESGNAWVYADLEPLAGYLPPAARERLSGTPFGVVTRVGRGHAVLFADDPAFRGIVHALARAYLDAVLLVPAS